MNWKNLMLGTMATALLAACGGGGGSNSSSPAYNVSGNSAFGNGSSGSSTGSGSGSGSTSTTNVTSNTAGSLILALSSSTVSASQPATITAVVKDAAGAPIAGALVQFSLSGAGSATLATLSPQSAITDVNGQAASTVTPASGATVGAAYVLAQADTSAGSLSAKQAFSVTATNVTLSPVSVSPSAINGYDTSLITINLTGASSTNPVTVSISSTCATSGKATISPTTLTMTGGSGTATYQDKGCGNTSGSGSVNDLISVQVAGTTQQQSKGLTVAAPVTQGIQFVSVDNATICLQGSGCPSVANVVFKTVDNTGVAQAGRPVVFSLTNQAATLGSTSGVTGADGTVSVAVAAKRTPSPVRVIAQVTTATGTLQTVSNNLTISGGLPVAGSTNNDNGITFAAAKYSLMYSWVGDYADLTLSLTDRWGAPAIDGTVVNLVSDGGTVVPAYCTTAGGTCSVKLLVSNPQPDTGRVHVVAYAYGQEAYTDTNGDGIHESNEPFDDVRAAVCLDRDESGTISSSTLCSASEFIVGDSTKLNSGDGVWNDGGSAFAQIQHTFIFSRTDLTPRLFQVSGGACTNTAVDAGYMTVTVPAKSSTYIDFCVRDGNTNGDAFQDPTTHYVGNPLPSGTTIAAASTVTGVTFAISNQPISLLANGVTMHRLTIANGTSSALTAGTGSLTFTFPAPGYPKSTSGATPPASITLDSILTIH
jgi:hypothetical protein